MSVLLAALVAMAVPSGAANRTELAQCLAHLSNAPEFRSISSDDLANNVAFLEAAERSYCSDEVLPFWKIAHQRARAKLGLPGKGFPAPEQQEFAEREIRSLLRESWQTAQRHRANPRPLSEAKMTNIALAWLLDDQNDSELQKIADQPLRCVAKDARKGEAQHGTGRIKPSKGRADVCGYHAALQKIANLIRVRFPDVSEKFAAKVAEDYLSQMAFWATLSAPGGNNNASN
ncbi:MAG TPA: hypothetical protein VNH53_11190 [Sphingomicrobium sp.]|jgi:hypothetical protein|nr:hypothetical protein [Sphingomicrobium sp.]